MILLSSFLSSYIELCSENYEARHPIRRTQLGVLPQYCTIYSPDVQHQLSKVYSENAASPTTTTSSTTTTTRSTTTEEDGRIEEQCSQSRRVRCSPLA